MTGKFYLIPKANTLNPPLLHAAKAYWAGVFDKQTGINLNRSFTYRAGDINRTLVREGGLLGSVTKAVRRAFELFYVFECHTCGKQTERVLSAPLRSVYYETQRRPPTRCIACENEAARDHDESELDRATDFLLRKFSTVRVSEAVPIIAAAQSMSISLNYLTRARQKLGIVSVKVGTTYRWLWLTPEPAEDDPWPWRTAAQQRKPPCWRTFAELELEGEQ